MAIFNSYVKLPERSLKSLSRITTRSRHHFFTIPNPIAPPPERSSPSCTGKRGVSPLHSWTSHLPQVGLLDLASLNAGKMRSAATWRHLDFSMGISWLPMRIRWYPMGLCDIRMDSMKFYDPFMRLVVSLRKLCLWVCQTAKKLTSGKLT